METVLIVEDDPTLLRGLKDNFAYKGYRVVTATDGRAGLEAAVGRKPDLVILDIMLPEINGYEVCRLIREQDLDMPIIMLTAKGQEADILLGLNIGADDYVTKPFSIGELLARANAFLRRRRRGRAQVYRFADFELDTQSRKLLRDGQEAPLTPKEFGALEYLLRRAGSALTRDDILREVWGSNIIVTTRSVDRCINTLRSKIESSARHPTFIKTVREIGYRFEGAEAGG